MDLKLGNIHILLAEDEPYIRGLFLNILRSLGATHTTSVSNGIEAIRAIENPHDHVDLVIADLFMSPINGLSLLQFVRHSKDSPDRFIPFIMLSGYADEIFVKETKEMGVSEFIAKPFSVRSIEMKITSALNDTRQFVMAHNYFGPDRRRNDIGLFQSQKDRRRAQGEHITTIYTIEQMENVMETATFDKGQAFYFRLPNITREKVAGNPVSGLVRFRIPPSFLNKADKLIREKTPLFPQWIKKYARGIEEEIGGFRKEIEEKGHLVSSTERVNKMSMEIKGIAGIFKRPEVVKVSEKIYELTSPIIKQDSTTIRLIETYLQALNKLVDLKREDLSQKTLEDLDNALQDSVNTIFERHNVNKKKIQEAHQQNLKKTAREEIETIEEEKKRNQNKTEDFGETPKGGTSGSVLSDRLKSSLFKRKDGLYELADKNRRPPRQYQSFFPKARGLTKKEAATHKNIGIDPRTEPFEEFSFSTTPHHTAAKRIDESKSLASGTGKKETKSPIKAIARLKNFFSGF